MKNAFVISLIAGFALLIACGDGDIQMTTDPAIQRAEDIILIDEYLRERGFSESEIDTTERGVRYVIIDEGQNTVDSLTIEESDIVFFDYIGMMLNDTIFETSIQAVADSIQDAFEETPQVINGDTIPVFTSNRDREPLFITYSETGWSIPPTFLIENIDFISFSDGLEASLKNVGVGGRVLLVLPSDLAYGSFGEVLNGIFIPVHTNVAYEVFPVAVQKQ